MTAQGGYYSSGNDIAGNGYELSTITFPVSVTSLMGIIVSPAATFAKLSASAGLTNANNFLCMINNMSGVVHKIGVWWVAFSH